MPQIVARIHQKQHLDIGRKNSAIDLADGSEFIRQSVG
jgi:hypothetical protein